MLHRKWIWNRCWCEITTSNLSADMAISGCLHLSVYEQNSKECNEGLLHNQVCLVPWEYLNRNTRNCTLLPTILKHLSFDRKQPSTASLWQCANLSQPRNEQPSSHLLCAFSKRKGGGSALDLQPGTHFSPESSREHGLLAQCVTKNGLVLQ